jgi:hypothetical protein
MPPAADAGRLALRIAPRFHDPLGLAARIAVSDGAECEGRAFGPRGPFREPSAEELAALVSAPDADRDALSSWDVGLLRLPQHLVAAWWEVAEGAGADGTMAGFAAFADEVVELLRWKSVPLPEPTRCEAIALSADGRPGTSPVAEAAGDPRVAPRVIANLGPAAADALLVPLAGAEIADRLAARGVSVPEETGAARARRYLREVRGAALVRLRLEPGDGLWLPPVALLLDVAAAELEDVVVLSLRAG